MSESTDPSGVAETVSDLSDTIRLRVWRGSVPVTIIPPDPLKSYGSLRLRVPRLSYLPTFYDRLREHFNIQSSRQQHLVFTTARAGHAEVEDQTWSIVQTHYPMGLIYDLNRYEGTLVLLLHLIHPQGPTCKVVSEVKPSDTAMEKVETIRTQTSNDNQTPSLVAVEKALCATESFVNVQYETELSALVWNGLKQATILRYGTVRDLQNLTPLQSESLRRAISQLDFINYWKIARRILSTSKVRHIPARILFQRRSGVQNKSDQETHELRTIVVQDLLLLQTERIYSTVGSLLQKFVPFVYGLGEEQVDALLHGCVVAWSLQLRDLLEECIYVDSWLYFVLRARCYRPHCAISHVALPDSTQTLDPVLE